jgi:hypothetical protein
MSATLPRPFPGAEVGWRLCRKDVFLSGDSETYIVARL